MKKVIYLIVIFFCAISSCNKDDENIISNEISKTNLKEKQEKISICHYDEYTNTWKTINISGNSLDSHLSHGDIVGQCSSSILYDFNNCTINGFNSNNEGTVSITDLGLTGCGVQLDRPSRLKTDSHFSYGTYEMDTRASTSVSNQYMRLFVSEDFSSVGVDIGIQPNGTDDEGYTFIVNGEIIKWEVPSEIPVSYPNWYHVKVEVTPDYIKFWLDESLMLEMYDYGGITNPFGSFEVSSYSTSEFDNLKYTPL